MSPVLRRKTTLDRRARLGIASGLLFFVAIQVAFRIALAWHPMIGDREFGRKLEDLRAKLTTASNQPLIVMLGSSRVATGFKPDALPLLNSDVNREPIAFNFAQVGTGPQLSHLVLHRLLSHGIKPDWVLVEFWPPFWATDGYLNGYIDSLNLAALDWPAVKLLARYLPKSKALYTKWLPAQLTPIFASRFVLLSRLGASWAPNFDLDRRLQNLDLSGWWAPRTTIEAGDRTRLVEHYRGVYSNRLNHLKIRATPDRALQDLLALCRSKEIKVAVIVLPESNDFRSPSILPKPARPSTPTLPSSPDKSR